MTCISSDICCQDETGEMPFGSTAFPRRLYAPAATSMTKQCVVCLFRRCPSRKLWRAILSRGCLELAVLSLLATSSLSNFCQQGRGPMQVGWHPP